MTTWILCEDSAHSDLRPLTWLRPASELLLGTERGEARWRRLVGADPLHVVCRDAISKLKPGRVAWSGIGSLELSGDVIWVRDRFLPDDQSIEQIRSLPLGGAASFGGTVVARRTAPDDDAVFPSRGGSGQGSGSDTSVVPWMETAPTSDDLTSGHWLGGLGDLVRSQAILLPADLERHLHGGPTGISGGSAKLGASGRAGESGTTGVSGVSGPSNTSGGVQDGFAYRPENIWVHPSARIDHGAILDARDGAIVLGANCEVHSGAILKGPMFAEDRCLFLGGPVGDGSSFGSVTRVRGEVETTVFLGYSNKAHDGFVGHSYVGEWVNLGALTTTSDLKNNYGEIALEVDGRVVKSGSNKIGTFFGDHTKTRIGCLLNTGTVLGMGVNVFGEPAVPDRYVADFLWGTGNSAVEYRLDKFLSVAEIVLGRRKVPWSEPYQAALSDAFQQSAPARQRFFDGYANRTGSA